MDEGDVSNQDHSAPAMVVIPGGKEEPSAPPASDFHREWMKLVDAGADEGELVALAFDYCHIMVFSIANRITGSRWEAEDITQTAFESFARRLGSVRDPARIPGFLKTAAVRISLRQVKRGRWRREQISTVFGDEDKMTRSDDAAMAASVYQLLERLDYEERTAVVLKFVEMHSHDEVAKLMGVSVSTVRRRLDSAKQKLASIVGPERLGEILGREGEG
jgi:RNA polymerase sigma-70 factor (ECF subfamily)